MSEEEAAHHWVKTFVNQCKTGTDAELRLFCEGGHLKVTICADLGQLTAGTGKYSDCWGAPRGGPSRVRRRERRAAERAAVAALGKVAAEEVAAEKAAPEKVDAEKATAGKLAPEEVVFVKVAAEKEVAKAEEVIVKKATTEKVVAEQVAAEKATAEKVAAKGKKSTAEKEAAKNDAAEASTSCCGSELPAPLSWNCDVMELSLPAPLVFTPAKKLETTSCLNCDAAMVPDHQCQVGGSASGEGVQQLAPLPLCLYCCHRGSDGHPVHFFLECVCSDDECTCFCYCDDEQYQLKRLIFPSGLGNKRAETPEARAHARATALASEWFSEKPLCVKEDCCNKCEYDTSCQLDNNLVT